MTSAKAGDRLLSERKSSSDGPEAVSGTGADTGLRTGGWAGLIVSFAAMAMLGRGACAQDQAAAGDGRVNSLPVMPVYHQPSEQQRRSNYLFEAYGPYPLAWTTPVAGWHQAMRTPPEWREGWPGYGERYGSDFAASAVNINVRFGLAEALNEDTMYYRCGCRGVWPRLEHAVVWTAMAHRGADGRKALAAPTLGAPTWLPRPRCMVGIRGATGPGMRSGWATTGCSTTWAATSAWSFSRRFCMPSATPGWRGSTWTTGTLRRRSSPGSEERRDARAAESLETYNLLPLISSPSNEVELVFADLRFEATSV
jgi:hypothetical protein